MKQLTLEQHKARLDNLRAARVDNRGYTRELRIHDYLPGQVIYYLGDYPAPMSITPTEYDYNLLKSYAEHGVDMIQVHEEWNDTVRRFGADKWSSCDHEGMLKFVELCHYFGIKILPYCSAGFIHTYDKEFLPEFVRRDGGCVDMHYHYSMAYAGSAYWREFILPRSFRIMDTYGFDGLFNDWGLDSCGNDMVPIPENRRNYENSPLEYYFPEAEDLVHMLYDGVKQRGGIYKVHIGGNASAPIRGKYYDYIWIGESKYETEIGVGKMWEPYVVPCPDKKRIVVYAQQKFDADAYFASTIPFVQFPLLTHGRPTMGECIDVPGVRQWNTTQPTRLYHFYEKVRDYAREHPDGPYVYSEWSQIPDDPEDYPRWCRYLDLYKPMVEDETVVYMELRDTDLVTSEIPSNVYVTQFVSHEEYIVASNLGDAPYTLALRDTWEDRVSGTVAKAFEIPAKRMVFLKKA